MYSVASGMFALIESVKTSVSSSVDMGRIILLFVK